MLEIILLVLSFLFKPSFYISTLSLLTLQTEYYSYMLQGYCFIVLVFSLLKKMFSPGLLQMQEYISINGFP